MSEESPRLKERWARSLIFHSILGGLCPLIPLPWIDDAVLGSVRRRMVRSILEDPSPSRSYVELLTEPERRGCLEGCLVGLVIYPIKKIFRKIFIFLTIKECVDEASRTFHIGYLAHHALTRGDIDRSTFTDDGTATRALRASMDRTLAEVDTRPITKILKRTFEGSRHLLRTAARRLFRAVRSSKGKGEEAVDEAIGDTTAHEDPEMKGFIDTISREIWLEQGYLQQLEAIWEKHVKVSGEQD